MIGDVRENKVMLKNYPHRWFYALPAQILPAILVVPSLSKVHKRLTTCHTFFCPDQKSVESPIPVQGHYPVWLSSVTPMILAIPGGSVGYEKNRINGKTRFVRSPF